MTAWLGGTTTRLYAPQDLRTVDPRPLAQSFDEWAKGFLTGRLEQRFGPDSEIAKMLDLAEPPVVSRYDSTTHDHRIVYRCTRCGKERTRSRKSRTVFTGVCPWCTSGQSGATR